MLLINWRDGMKKLQEDCDKINSSYLLIADMMFKVLLLCTALAATSAVLKFPLSKIPDHEFVQDALARAAAGVR